MTIEQMESLIQSVIERQNRIELQNAAPKTIAVSPAVGVIDSAIQALNTMADAHAIAAANLKQMRNELRRGR